MKSSNMEQIPPGIIQFRTDVGNIHTIDTGRYEQWYHDFIETGCQIWTIEQDGKRYSVGDKVKNKLDPKPELTIKSFEWDTGRHFWWVHVMGMEIGEVVVHVKYLIPQPSPEDKEEERRRFNQLHEPDTLFADPPQPSEAEKIKSESIKSDYTRGYDEGMRSGYLKAAHEYPDWSEAQHWQQQIDALKLSNSKLVEGVNKIWDETMNTRADKDCLFNIQQICKSLSSLSNNTNKEGG